MNKTHLYWGIILIIGIGVFFSLSSNDDIKLGNNYVYDPEHRHIVGERYSTGCWRLQIQ